MSGALFLLILLATGGAFGATVEGGALVGGAINPVERWDVLVIMPDDFGQFELPDAYPDRGEVGFTSTPQLATLASQGVRFQNFQVGSVCTPTRMGLLTGQLQTRHGNYSNQAWTWPAADYPTWAHDMPAAYRLAMVGKIPVLGDMSNRDAKTAGYMGFNAGYVTYSLQSGYRPHSWITIEATGTAPELIVVDADTADSYLTDGEVDYLAAWWAATPSPKAAMWLPMTAHSTFHDPAQARIGPTTTSCGPGAPDSPEEICYRQMIEDFDTKLGELLAGIDLATTLVCVIGGDNGGPNQMGAAGKRTAREIGVNMGQICVGGPVANAPRNVATRHSMLDWLPTLLELGGADVSQIGRTIDGVSMAGVLRDDATPALPEFWIYYNGDDKVWMVTTNRVGESGWRYLWNKDTGDEYLTDITGLPLPADDYLGGDSLCGDPQDCRAGLTAPQQAALDAMSAALQATLAEPGAVLPN